MTVGNRRHECGAEHFEHGRSSNGRFVASCGGCGPRVHPADGCLRRAGRLADAADALPGGDPDTGGLDPRHDGADLLTVSFTHGDRDG
jgi:hypothetical protein